MKRIIGQTQHTAARTNPSPHAERTAASYFASQPRSQQANWKQRRVDDTSAYDIAALAYDTGCIVTARGEVQNENHAEDSPGLMVPNFIDDEQGRRAGLVRLALATVRASEPVPDSVSVSARAPATGVEAQESDSASQFSSRAGTFPVAPLRCFLTVKTWKLFPADNPTTMAGNQGSRI